MALAIHAHQIAQYRGAVGIRDQALLESALDMPAPSFSVYDDRRHDWVEIKGDVARSTSASAARKPGLDLLKDKT